MFAATGFAVCWSVSISRETFCPYIRNAEAAFRNKSVTEFLHRWFEDGRVADRSKKEKHQGNGRTTIEHPESLQEIACVKQFDLVQGYSY